MYRSHESSVFFGKTIDTTNDIVFDGLINLSNNKQCVIVCFSEQIKIITYFTCTSMHIDH